MRALRAVVVRVLGLFRRARDEREFIHEVESHLELHIDDNLRAGMSPDEARRDALMKLGSIAGVREAWREQHGLPRLESVVQDARYALRGLRRNPGFAVACIATLALGIGANSAIFSVVDGILLAPLPYRQADRLVAIWRQHPTLGGGPDALSPADVTDLARSLTTMQGVEALQANIIPSTISVGGRTVAANGVRVSSGLFQLLGTDALVGRVITADAPDGVVLSHGFWQREFGADPSAIGRTLGQGASALTVIGVMPPTFTFPYASMLRAPISFTRATEVDFWVALPPLSAVREPGTSTGVDHLLAAVARLREDVALDRARADVEVAWRRIALASPEANAGWQPRVVPLHEQAVAPVQSTLVLLLAGVGVILLIACVNVAGMLLGRGLARQHELSLRAALGAGPGRLLQQGLVESLVLSSIGAGAGLLLARWATPVLVRWAPTSTPRLHEVSLDARVAVFAAALAVLSGVLVGLAPAIGSARVEARTALAERGRGATAGRRRLRGALVAVEVALAVVLAVGATLLARSFTAVLNVDAGFRSDRLLTLAINVPGQFDTATKRSTFYERLFSRLEAIPGVEAAGGTTRLPLGGANSTTEVAVEGRVPPEGQWPRADLRRALHAYFQAMDIPLLRGRWFDDRDRAGAQPVAIVNERFVQRMFGGADPVGQQLRLGANAPLRRAVIVGVIGDLHHEGLDVSPAPEVYVSSLQAPPVAPLIVLRTSDDPAALAPAVRAALREVDSALSPYNIRTMADLRSASVADRRFVVRLVGSFALLALVLTAVGVYGVMALSVAERRREMGIRLALGAHRRRLMGMVLRQALALAGAGGAGGMALALALSPLMASQLYGVSPRDPVAVAIVGGLLIVVALIAAAIPARRILGVDPATTLRCD